MIKDSGNRTKFESGAVRDMQEGKGRCDLLPLDVAGVCANSVELIQLSDFIEYGHPKYLQYAIDEFTSKSFVSMPNMLLEVAKHFEEGAKKYGERNWQKGIPVRCYIDSGVRHYLKWLRGDDDERHDRAFCWNMLCAIWTCKYKPELNEYAKENENDKA